MNAETASTESRDEPQLTQNEKLQRKPTTLRMSGSYSSANGFKPFLSDFDPERSDREIRKLTQRLYPGGKRRILYDDKGIYIRTKEDLCDCLQSGCPGCHFPCPGCESTKCAAECRVNRKWMYESIEDEGTDVIVKNPLLPR
ncbi:ARL14 effector protein-like isoform X1 [Athalia rosae]|uniref:ARL14 effector protein-like isoform X1 n=1 Tax=Athalia rosae TaxID=37344 RepID=UPI0020344269|nr:ARL14 effector protein-like isoform X1 [Athalia rosae]XP_020712326.2 ARL14 effector protein-like isoform X1 [Athalia rosae]XP_020712327.2 ARL14 effector protein-like isoform X1 [Athalia rosae]XP_048505022.1 ARL14 effector protein-like isoform X1 [Athalia rosae]